MTTEKQMDTWCVLSDGFASSTTFLIGFCLIKDFIYSQYHISTNLHVAFKDVNNAAHKRGLNMSNFGTSYYVRR